MSAFYLTFTIDRPVNEVNYHNEESSQSKKKV